MVHDPHGLSSVLSPHVFEILSEFIKLWYTNNCITEIASYDEDKVLEISHISQKWLENLSKGQMEELGQLIVLLSYLA